MPLRHTHRAGLVLVALLAVSCTDDFRPASDSTVNAPATTPGDTGGADDTGDTSTVVSDGAEGASSGDGSAVVTAASTAPEPTSAPTVGLTAAEAESLLARFDTRDQIAFSILADARADPNVVAAARHVLEAGARGGQRWAATYVWVNEGDDAEPLVALAVADDPVIRVMAATGLLARGRIEGFEPLFALLTDDSAGSGWPPTDVWQQATLALVRFTAISANGPPLDGNVTQRASAVAMWQGWLDEHRATLVFDAEVALWRVS